MSAEFRVAYLTGGTGLYLRASAPDHTVWNKDTAAFEAWNDANKPHYAIPLTEIGSLGEYRAAIPDGWPKGVYTILFYDPAISTSPAGSSLLNWKATEEATPVQQQDYLDQQLSNLQSHVDGQLTAMQSHGDTHWQAGGVVTVTPISATVDATWFDQKYLEAVQFARIGPIDLTLKDGAGLPVNVSGCEISFVVYRDNGTYLFQLDNCLVLGDDNNIVRVSEPDGASNTVAGHHRYVLRDVTNDRALLLGEFHVICAADAR